MCAVSVYFGSKAQNGYWGEHVHRVIKEGWQTERPDGAHLEDMQ